MATPLEPVGPPVVLRGHVRSNDNLSAVAVCGDLLLVASDEDDRVQVLARDGDHYRLLPDTGLVLNATGAEADVEGLAIEGDRVYVVGSHAARRRKLDPDDTYARNRTRMLEPNAAPESRCVFATARITPDGRFTNVAVKTLSPLIKSVPVLAPFRTAPGKENGVDIEALAVANGEMTFGLRGPVLQGGYAVALRTRSVDVQPDVLFVPLGGLGFRDLSAVPGGFLVLAGPTTDIGTEYALHFWNGRDALPGGDGPGGVVKLLGPLPAIPGAKPEGLAVERETDSHWTVLVLYDGLKDGGAQRFKVRKPGI